MKKGIEASVLPLANLVKEAASDSTGVTRTGKGREVVAIFACGLGFPGPRVVVAVASRLA